MHLPSEHKTNVMYETNTFRVALSFKILWMVMAAFSFADD